MKLYFNENNNSSKSSNKDTGKSGDYRSEVEIN